MVAPRWWRAVACAAIAFAELPVHCSVEQVVGEWRFHLSPAAPQRSSCGHVRPDDPRKEPRELGPQSAKWSVLLDQDHALSEGTVGAWTMAADALRRLGARLPLRGALGLHPAPG